MADRVAPADALGIVAVVEVAPRHHHAVGVVDRHHPAGEAAAPEILRGRGFLEQAAVLHQRRQQIVVQAHPDVIADAPRVGIEKARERAFVPFGNGQLGEGGELLELGPGHARVEEDAVERVHRVLGDLQPVAGRVNRVRNELVVGLIDRVQHGEGRPRLRRPEIGEDQAAVLAQRIGAVEDMAGDAAGLGLARRLQDRAVDVVEPAMIAAADAGLADDAELERGAAVAAMRVQEPEAAAAVAKQHQILAENAHAQRQVLDPLGHRHGEPEAPEILAGRRARPDPRPDGVFRFATG